MHRVAALSLVIVLFSGVCFAVEDTGNQKINEFFGNVESVGERVSTIKQKINRVNSYLVWIMNDPEDYNRCISGLSYSAAADSAYARYSKTEGNLTLNTSGFISILSLDNIEVLQGHLSECKREMQDLSTDVEYIGSEIQQLISNSTSLPSEAKKLSVLKIPKVLANVQKSVGVLQESISDVRSICTSMPVSIRLVDAVITGRSEEIQISLYSRDGESKKKDKKSKNEITVKEKEKSKDKLKKDEAVIASSTRSNKFADSNTDENPFDADSETHFSRFHYTLVDNVYYRQYYGTRSGTVTSSLSATAIEIKYMIPLNARTQSYASVGINVFEDVSYLQTRIHGIDSHGFMFNWISANVGLTGAALSRKSSIGIQAKTGVSWQKPLYRYIVSNNRYEYYSNPDEYRFDDWTQVFTEVSCTFVSGYKRFDRGVFLAVGLRSQFVSEGGWFQNGDNALYTDNSAFPISNFALDKNYLFISLGLNTPSLGFLK
ncbi:MAG: hypothetical protein Q8M98_08920 [Candidatus Cloacimonadaceae bacterium]|nr:hypothetical protein [Candidatus Cloacimonadaceae bacterium]